MFVFTKKDVCPICDAMKIFVSWQNVRSSDSSMFSCHFKGFEHILMIIRIISSSIWIIIILSRIIMTWNVHIVSCLLLYVAVKLLSLPGHDTLESGDEEKIMSILPISKNFLHVQWSARKSLKADHSKSPTQWNIMRGHALCILMGI